MAEKNMGIIEEEINKRLQNRKKPIKKEKNNINWFVLTGSVLFAIIILFSLVKQF